MDPVERVLADWSRERPALDASPIAIFGRIRRVSGLAFRNLESYLAPFGLTPNSFDVLANLRRGGAPYRKTPSELAASSVLTTGAMTGRLDSMEQAGLIRRTPHPHDRRVKYAELTETGKDLIDKVIEAHIAEEEKLLAQLSPEQRDTIARSLADLERSMNAALSDEP